MSRSVTTVLETEPFDPQSPEWVTNFADRNLTSDRRVGRGFDRVLGKMVAMVLPKGLALFNRAVTNRVTRPLAWWLPGFGVVVHRGRRSGREYRTPINTFRLADGYVAALTYGLTDWARNVTAAGSCELLTRGQRIHLTDPRLVHDPSRRDMPPVVRQIIGMIGVRDFLYLRAVPNAGHLDEGQRRR